jgi:hypothetical protein
MKIIIILKEKFRIILNENLIRELKNNLIFFSG